MRRALKGRRPSPSMAVAIVALVFAVAGTSMAGVATISALSKKEKKQTRNIAKTEINKAAPKIANTEINKAAPKLAVKSAQQADGPAAWAHVSAAGTLLDGRGVSQPNVSIGSANVICFGGLSFPFKAAVASVDYWNGTLTFSNIAEVGVASSGGIGGSGCPAGTQAFTKGWNANTSTTSPTAVWITFFN